jgi:hypothetical protein
MSKRSNNASTRTAQKDAPPVERAVSPYVITPVDEFDEIRSPLSNGEIHRKEVIIE